MSKATGTPQTIRVSSVVIRKTLTDPVAPPTPSTSSRGVPCPSAPRRASNASQNIFCQTAPEKLSGWRSHLMDEHERLPVRPGSRGRLYRTLCDGGASSRQVARQQVVHNKQVSVGRKAPRCRQSCKLTHAGRLASSLESYLGHLVHRIF